MPEAANVLEIRGLQAWYGESHVLHGIDLTVREGECVTLLGRNGAGRSTTLKAILGLTDRRAGSVKVQARRRSGSARTRLPGSASATARRSAASTAPSPRRRTSPCCPGSGQAG